MEGLGLVEVALAAGRGRLACLVEILPRGRLCPLHLCLQLVGDAPLVHVLHLRMVLHGHGRYLMVVHGLL